MLSEYEIRVLQDFENDFAKDRSRASARLRRGALALVLVAAALAGCLIGTLLSAFAGALIGSLGVVAACGTAWLLRRRHRTAG